jgi:hypothetical protein
MHDRPTAIELITAARQYLETDLIPSLTDARLRFQTLVAANVLSIVERELTGEEAFLTVEWDLLSKVLGVQRSAPERLSELRQSIRDANADLCKLIRQGHFDERPPFRELSHELCRLVKRKLEIANPKYLARFYGESRKDA